MIRFLNRHRASLVLSLLLVGGAICAELVAQRSGTGPGAPALSSRDAGPTGALALALWLEKLGYDVRRIEGTEAWPLESDEVLFILRPRRGFDRAEAQGILEWVRRGGVLIYVPSPVVRMDPASGRGGDGLADELKVESRFGPLVEQAAPSFPFFSAPPASRFAVKSQRAFQLEDDAWVPLIEDGGRVFAAVRQLGQGRVYASVSEALFANEGIGQQDNQTFVLNVLAHHPAQHGIAIEEAHHAMFEAPDIIAIMRSSPWGWATVYAALVSFGFVVWGGRRFGPAVVPASLPGRSGGEYVTAFAGLLQRARAANWAQAQYARLLRRRLARTLGVRADVPAADLAGLLAERWPVDAPALAQHLAAVDGPPVGERGLLTHVRALEEMLRVVRGRER